MKHTIFFDSILVFQDNSWLHNLNKFTEDYIIKSRSENKIKKKQQIIFFKIAEL